MGQGFSDGVVGAQLAGAACRWAQSGDFDRYAAVEELRRLAAGRDDLLTMQAGLLRGRFKAEPVTAWRLDVAAELCTEAGGSESETEHWVEIGRERMAYSSSTGR